MLNLKGLFTKERLSNAGTWISVASFMVTILVQSGVIDFGMGDQINGLVSAITGFLTFAGILNDPTTKSKGFGDDKSQEPQPESNK